MSALKNAWDKVVNGSGQVLGVVGEAGVGKSRLLLEFRRSLANKNLNYFEGRCLHYAGSMAYLPFLDILRSYFDIAEGQREYIIKKNIKEKLKTVDRESLSISIPAYQDMLSLKIDDESWNSLEPKQRRERTFESLKNLFICLSKEKPLILAVEDLHWMDKSSEEFLSYFIDSMAHSPILLILLYRPEYIHQWGSKTYYGKIGLDQLTLELSAELVSAILEGSEIAPELKELILNRSAGNPLFMEEFMHTLLENGSIERKNNQFVLSKRVDDIQVPDTIQGIIAARIDRLEENLKRTMQVASVVGRDFAFRILQTITGMKEELKAYLLNLQGLEFIYEKSLFPELEYIFKHALTQEVAYNSLLQKRRKEIHEKIGRAIEELYPERLEEFYEMLAYHCARSDNLEKALYYLKRSGDRAARRGSHQEALRLLKQALAVLDRMPDTAKNKRERIKVHVLLHTPLRLSNFPEGSLEMLQEGERLAKEMGDARNVARCYSFISVYHTFKGEPLLAQEYSEHSFREAQKAQDLELMLRVAPGLCASYNALGDARKIISVASPVIDSLEKSALGLELMQGFNLYSHLCALQSVALSWMGQLEEASRFAEKGLQAATKSNDWVSLAMAELFYGFVDLSKGDGKSATEHFQKSIRYCEKTKDLFVLGLAWTGLGLGCLQLGDTQGARTQIKKGLRTHVQSGVAFGSTFQNYALCLSYYEAGDLGEARGYAEAALEAAHRNQEKHYEGAMKALLGSITGRMGIVQSAKAEEMIVQGMDILEQLGLKAVIAQCYSLLAEFYADTGQKEKAIQALRTAEQMDEEMGMKYELNKTRQILAKLQD
jgi:tetratricopeptide (TPR) repeat protein